jgi:hypothetical protein
MKLLRMIKSFFRGEVTLWKSFWLVDFPLHTITALINKITFFRFPQSIIINKIALLSQIWGYAILYFILELFTSIGLWRSASNYIHDNENNRKFILGHLIRVLVAWRVFLAIAILIAGMLSWI